MNLITILEMINKYTNILGKWLFSIVGGVLAVFEPIQAFVFVCGLAIIGDFYTSIKLGRRISKQHPDKASGKIQSSKIGQLMTTLLKVLFALYFAWQIDVYILADTALYATKVTAGIFCFSQIWSMLENESSFSNKKWARILQKIMIDKTIRHLDLAVDTFDILINRKNDNKHTKCIRYNKKRL